MSDAIDAILREDELAIRRDEREQARLAQLYKNVFGSMDGQEVLEDLMGLTRVFHSTFTGNSRTYLLEGRRQVGLYILSMLDMTNVAALQLMMESNLEQRKAEIINNELDGIE